MWRACSKVLDTTYFREPTQVKETIKETCCTYRHFKLHLSVLMCRLFYSLTSRGNIIIRGALFIYPHLGTHTHAHTLSPSFSISLAPSIPSSHPSLHTISLSSSSRLSLQKSIETQCFSDVSCCVCACVYVLQSSSSCVLNFSLFISPAILQWCLKRPSNNGNDDANSNTVLL